MLTAFTDGEGEQDVLASLRPSRRDRRLAAADIVRGLYAWPIWVLLGMNDIRQRYRRSRIGQFWITLSIGIFIASIGGVYSLLFGREVDDYIPYLATNYVVWGFISSTATDCTSVFIQSAGYLRQEALPKTIFVMRILARNFMILAHNVVVIPIVFIVFSVMPGPSLVLAIPGLFLLGLAGFATALIFGVLCTRFRDLPQIIQSLLQIGFFLTPVLWRPEQLPSDARLVVAINPLAAYLHIVTEPMLGQIPSLGTYARAFAATVILFAIALPLFARFRARIVYWL